MNEVDRLGLLRCVERFRCRTELSSYNRIILGNAKLPKQALRLPLDSS